MAKRKIKRRRSYQRVEKPKKMLKQMSRDHLDVLNCIESTIVYTCREHEVIDDRAVALALKTAIGGDEPADSVSALLINNLAKSRQKHPFVSDDIWIKGLKVVLFSVNNHSDKKPGTKDYLDFAGYFIS
ncbi:MAG: hypothetical protein KAJ07_03915 [Planctomycetes bacterium]|nr:hypothetical protein [Planctomycetota bacterium]